MSLNLGFSGRGDYCCTISCNHTRNKNNCKFYSFPKDEEWKKKWINSVNRQFVNENGKLVQGRLWCPSWHHKLCSCHFTDPPTPNARYPGWNHKIPDVFNFSVKNTPRATKRSAEAGTAFFSLDEIPKPKTRKRILFKDDDHEQNKDENIEHFFIEKENEQQQLMVTSINHDHDYFKTTRGGTLADEIDKISKKCPEFQYLLSDYNEAKKDQDEYSKMLSKGQIISLSNTSSTKSLFQYYTGLPSYEVFNALFDYLYDKAESMQYVRTSGQIHHSVYFGKKPGPKRVLSLENEFFSTLVRLRLGLPSKHCSKLFGISESTYSVIFNTWVILIANELEQLCCMPSVEKTMENSASCFDHFPYTRIVLDCTELFAQTPGTLNNHKQLHSFYKHHSTVKFLVGMSPSGAITYISDMWGGRASDKKITTESHKLLNSLECGDKVMVDRGFTIAEDLPAGVKLLIPPFKNKLTGQFTPNQIKYSEQISSARIHVERAMRGIKESRLLEMEVKLAMVNNFENIFKACAYLVNFKEPFLKVKK